MTYLPLSADLERPPSLPFLTGVLDLDTRLRPGDLDFFLTSGDLDLDFFAGDLDPDFFSLRDLALGDLERDFLPLGDLDRDFLPLAGDLEPDLAFLRLGGEGDLERDFFLFGEAERDLRDLVGGVLDLDLREDRRERERDRRLLRGEVDFLLRGCTMRDLHDKDLMGDISR